MLHMHIEALWEGGHASGKSGMSEPWHIYYENHARENIREMLINKLAPDRH